MTFTLYYNANKTGSKQYNVYVKNLVGTGKLTLTTGVAGSTSLVLEVGTYCSTAYVDEQGNVTLQAATPANVVEEGNYLPVTSDAVAQAISGGGVQDAFNAIYPIGCVYTQYPACKSPSEMGWETYSHWVEITSNYDGAFFRTYKSGTSGDFVSYGDSLTNKMQASQNLNHNHSGYDGYSGSLSMSGGNHRHNASNGYAAWSDSGTGYIYQGSNPKTTYNIFTNYSGNLSMSGGNHRHPISNDGGTEARPNNFAIKLWQRES